MSESGKDCGGVTLNSTWTKEDPMDVGKKVFIDTAPFIYLIENHPVFGAPIEQYLSACTEGESMLFTSVISYLGAGSV
jgi:hypothetical protein